MTLKELWEAVDSPYASVLVNILGDIQKDGYPPEYSDWKAFVLAVMEGMEALDSGLLDDFMPA